MSRTSQILAFSVPPAVVKEVESLAKKERRTKSELFREMVRVYERYRIQREIEEDRWIEKIVVEAIAEQAKNPMTVEEMRAKSTELARYGAEQTKLLGIKPKDLNRYIVRGIRERRKARRVQRAQA